MQQAYVFEQQERRPVVIGGLAVSVAALGAALVAGAPAIFVAVLAVPAALLIGAVWRNRRSGLRITAHSISLFAGRWSRLLALSDVEGARVKSWTDGQASVTLELRGGERFDIPGPCYGSGEAVARALESRGVPVARA